MPHGKPYSPHLISQNFCAWEPLLRTVSEERRVLPLLACWLRTLLAWLGTVPTMPWPLCWGGHRVDQGEGHRQPCRGLVLRVLPGVYVGVEIAMNYSSQPGSLQVWYVELNCLIQSDILVWCRRQEWENKWCGRRDERVVCLQTGHLGSSPVPACLYIRSGQTWTALYDEEVRNLEAWGEMLGKGDVN